MKRAALFLLFSIPAFTQAPISPPSFEVADVKVNKSGDPRINGGFLPGGQLSIRNATMKVLITAAYHISDSFLSGGPNWLESDRFDVIAKAPPTTSEDDLRRMLQTLLVDRFKLAVHQDQKVMPVYALVVSKQSPALKPSDPPHPGDPRCTPGQGIPGDLHLECSHMSMADLAETLPAMAPAYVDMPVVDQTGIKGNWTFKLDWTPRGRINGGAGEGGRGGDGSAAPETTGITMFDALQAQLGLKLESKKLPMPILVIDHIDRVPTDN